MVRSIVASAVDMQADMRVADDCEGDDLEGAVTRSGADVLIVQERTDRSEAYYRPLFVSHPSLKVFILTEDGRDVMFLGFRRVHLPDASPTSLVDAIRAELRLDAAAGEP